ncbi:MAG: DUF4424 family protein [Akkermansiaceae bacterium]|nr:DUF4424 family protein [Akkermansiaceae bacterium]
MRSDILMLCFTLFTQSVFANGGGYFRGGVEKAGDIAGFEPEETEKIQILNEHLTVSLGPKDAEVEVRYVMRNQTDKKVKVRFGLPVEESFDQNQLMGGEAATSPDSKEKITLKYCQNYTISARGKPITAKWQIEEKEIDGNPDKRFKGIAGWLISEMTFSAHEEKPVTIQFKSGYPLEYWNISDNTSETPAIFRYRLSSAACWAGAIGTGRILLSPSALIPPQSECSNR